MKIVFHLFALFLLVLQSSAGFTQCPPTNVRECIELGGLCYGSCPAPYREIGSCGCGASCCQWRFMVPMGAKSTTQADEKLSQ
ncbi:beta-defensin 5-like [Mauremys reevesii]|uniref:beta-defensin 5-like n=1 Tax=Mauremys reevesii TaxID=260615 RepID=UPI00193F5F60|nr:beta-defensin 5-like [Mauremys reevesii]